LPAAHIFSVVHKILICLTIMQSIGGNMVITTSLRIY
jgi:hypothetical protein